MGYLSVLEHKGWDRLIIQTLAIRWTVRRQGWARRLLEQVIREGREAGWGRFASGRRRQPRSQDPLSGAGVSPGVRLPDYYGPGQHAHRLVLALGMSGRRHHELRRLPGHGHQGPARALPVCAAQTFLIGVVGWLVWWWCGADTSVNALTGLLFALGARVSSCCIWRCSHGESWANATYNVLIFQEDK